MIEYLVNNGADINAKNNKRLKNKTMIELRKSFRSWAHLEVHKKWRAFSGLVASLATSAYFSRLIGIGIERQQTDSWISHLSDCVPILGKELAGATPADGTSSI